ncbi:MAG: AMP-binding protein [Planctomycetota bacterium]
MTAGSENSASVQPERVDTLAGVIAAAAVANPDAAALVSRDETVTFGELSRRVDRLACSLIGRGIRPGDCVGVLLNSSIDFVVAFAAVLRSGAVLAPLNVKHKARELRYCLKHADVAAAIVGPEFIGVFEGVRDDVASLESVLLLGDAPLPSGWIEGSSAANEEKIDLASVDVTPDDDALMFFTSGTTGQPKGVVCTHRNCLAAIDSWIDALAMTARTRSMMVTPYFHNAFNAFVFAPLRVGGSSVVLEGFQLKTLFHRIERDRPSLLFATPSIYIAMLAYAERRPVVLGSIDTAVYGAAPMPPPTIRALPPLLPGAGLFNAYAQSETCPAISYLRPEFALKKLGSVGKAVPGVEIAVLDDGGEPLPAGEVGEICVRGANVMKGYHKQPERTAEKLTGSWLRTGDLGYLDSDGFLFLVDRKDDMIISAGETFYPSDVEELVRSMPGVHDVSVVGVPHRVKGKVPAAFVVAGEASALDGDAVRAHCIEHLADIKVPRFVEFVDELPRNASGKVIKQQLLLIWDEHHRTHDRDSALGDRAGSGAGGEA